MGVLVLNAANERWKGEVACVNWIGGASSQAGCFGSRVLCSGCSPWRTDGIVVPATPCRGCRGRCDTREA